MIKTKVFLIFGIIQSMSYNNIEFQQTINNLESNKTYYWKIVAYPYGDPGFKSETLVHSFRMIN